MKAVMTPAHARWDEFTAALEGPDGCNFRKDERKRKSRSRPIRPGPRIVWTCSSRGHELATPILKTMKCDVEKSIAFFREHGGCCDCEVLFNVERSFKRPRRPQRRRVSKETVKRVKRMRRKGRSL